MDNMNNNYNNQNGYQQGEQYAQGNYPQGSYQQTYYQQGMYQQDKFQQPYNQGNLQELENKATMAMVFGIIGLFFAGVIFGILALVNANACKKAGYSNGKVTAGFVLGILDLVALVIIMLIVFAAMGGAVMSAVGSM